MLENGPNRLLTRVLDGIPGAVAVWDAEDVLVAHNQAYEELIPACVARPLGGMRHAAAIAALGPLMAFPTDAAQSAAIAALLTTDAAVSVDLPFADGRRFRLSSRPIGSGRVGVAVDVTRERIRERELDDARQQAEAADRAKTAFLASMSHELRTPLHAVLGFAQLLLRMQREPLTGQQREMVGSIVRGGEQLLRLVEDVLELAHIEAQGVSVSSEPLALGAVIRQVLGQLAGAAETAQVRVLVAGDLDAQPPIRADSARFSQILTHLGSNAIKFNRPGGTVTFSVHPRRDTARVVVTDGGLGVPPEQRHNLFRAFHRAGRETGSIPGTGIGLAVSRRLAEMMGGSVGYREAPSGGSEFWVEVPRFDGGRRRPSSSPGFPRIATPSVRPGAPVLYIDGDVSGVEVVAAALAPQRIELITASTAEAGIDIARELRPSLILMEIRLPGMSGFDALRILRSAPDTEAIPVVALSAGTAIEECGLTAGFDGQLRKPILSRDLEETLRGLLRDA